MNFSIVWFIWQNKQMPHMFVFWSFQSDGGISSESWNKFRVTLSLFSSLISAFRIFSLGVCAFVFVLVLGMTTYRNVSKIEKNGRKFSRTSMFVNKMKHESRVSLTIWLKNWKSFMNGQEQHSICACCFYLYCVLCVWSRVWSDDLRLQNKHIDNSLLFTANLFAAFALEINMI